MWRLSTNSRATFAPSIRARSLASSSTLGLSIHPFTLPLASTPSYIQSNLSLFCATRNYTQQQQRSLPEFKARSGLRTTAELRRSFIDYFKAPSSSLSPHLHVASAPLIPSRHDASLFFINSGMAPFKDYFLGNEVPPSERVVSVQKCLRAGGKHNDLDQVGHTLRHHTFFEMMGNFSFGDYFKEGAIAAAWEYLTQVIGLPKERLFVSVHKDDHEAAHIWMSQHGIPEERLLRLGDADNFWSMGPTGPCGPCTEIYYDMAAINPAVSPQEKDLEVRLLEIWNLVFMQYNRTESGALEPLKKPCVDTGMGLERLASVVQGVTNNYDIDSMHAIMQRTWNIARQRVPSLPVELPTSGPELIALRVLVDHARACSFLIADGVVPASGRGYVLRRIIRRAMRYASSLGLNDPVLAEVAQGVIEVMGEAYPELQERAKVIIEHVHKEESGFLNVLTLGQEYFDDVLKDMKRKRPPLKEVPASEVFHMHVRLGFPADLTRIMAAEHGCYVNMDAVDQLLSKERDLSRLDASSRNTNWTADTQHWQASGIAPRSLIYDVPTEQGQQCVVRASSINSDTKEVVLSIDPCPFYAEHGGQAGDVGIITIPDHDVTAQVIDTQYAYEGGPVLRLRALPEPDETPVDAWNRLEAAVKAVNGTAQSVVAKVDRGHRKRTSAHHTATHLLHSALRSVLGTSISQAGSYVGPRGLRFDFTLPASSASNALSPQQIRDIEAHVRRAVDADIAVATEELPLNVAKQRGDAICLFGEKYPDPVRVVNVPQFSTEFCGGVHVQRTSEIRPFKITHQSSAGLGIRRIEAVAGDAAQDWYEGQCATIANLASLLEVAPPKVEERIKGVLQSEREFKTEVSRLRAALSTSSSSSTPPLQGRYNAHPVVLHIVESNDLDDRTLRSKVDAARQARPGCVHVLVSPSRLFCTSAIAQTSAQEILRDLLRVVGSGKGGGSAQMAQAVIAPSPQNLDKIKQFIQIN